MKEFEDNPKELNDYPSYWRTEALLSDKAKVVINQFEVLNPEPFDICQIKPQSYNLSIQYDREKRKEDDKAAKQKMKEKKMAQLRERAGDAAEEIAEPEPEKKKQNDEEEEAPKGPKIVLTATKQAVAKSMAGNA